MPKPVKLELIYINLYEFQFTLLKLNRIKETEVQTNEEISFNGKLR